MNKFPSDSAKQAISHLVPPSMATIVVAHGWASKRFDMWLFCHRLRKMGYDVVNWGYPSLRDSIDDHALSMNDLLADVEKKSKRAYLHLVGHSMGGIVIRKALLNSIPTDLIRVVMLASPNGGSFVAARVAPLMGRYLNTLAEVSDSSDSYVNRLGDLSHLEVGVVAASRDRVVKSEQVHLNGESDFTVINSGHAILPWKKIAAITTHRFLMTGKFKPTNQVLSRGTELATT